MLLLNKERKQMISELQVISDEPMLIDFLRKYFSHDEYADVFELETEERIKVAKERIKYGNSITPNYDIKKYTFYLLHTFIPSKYNINCFYVTVKNLKVVIFYEHILASFDNRDNEAIERNRKIKESKDIYDFYKALISIKKCNLSKFSNAIKLLNLTGITQNELDDDKYRIMHEFLGNLIFENYLVKYIEEYKNYL
jgi:hypothetical protein